MDVAHMQLASLGETHLAFDSVGLGDPIIFIHCGFTPNTFMPLMTEPALTSFQRITYCRRGHARSSPCTTAVSIAQQAADCSALLTKLNIERAHIVAHSYGGVIALELALSNPKQVQSLALLEPALVLALSGPAALRI